MSITINGSTNTITAASGLTVAGNTAVTGTLSATGNVTSGTGVEATPFFIANGASGAGKGGVFAIQSVGNYKTVFGAYNAISGGGGSDESGAIATFADNLYISAHTGKEIRFGINAYNAVPSQMVLSSTGLALTGTLSATVAATANALVLAASSGGDKLKIVPNAAGNGVDILARDTADSVLEPLALYGETVKLYASGGTLIGDISSTGLAVTGALSATGAILTEDGVNGRIKLLVDASRNYLLSYTTGEGAYRDLRILGASGNYIEIGSAGTALTGLLDLSAASSGQIKFPATQNASADANTLDDYEEGTWTPTLTYETPGDSSITQANYGHYVKIGRQVFIQFIVRLSAFTKGTATGQLKITGLPFTVLNDEQGTAVAIATYDSPFTSQPVASASGTEINLLRLVNGSAWAVLDDPDANSQYVGQLTYHV